MADLFVQTATTLPWEVFSHLLVGKIDSVIVHHVVVEDIDLVRS